MFLQTYRPRQANRFNKVVITLSSLLLLASTVGGCAYLGTTQPNKPYEGPYPAVFKELSAENRLLATEIAKLPEIQDGFSDKDVLALERISRYYHRHPEDFDTAFHIMYNEGYPDIRKFCTPLQALYWLALDDELERIDIAKYTLLDLLNEAWYKTGFEYDGKGRWDDFREVTERLNSPHLIDYYEVRNFSYKKVVGAGKNPRYIFKNKAADCWQYTSFSTFCLKRNGYRARAISVIHGRSSFANHVVCEYTDKDGKAYIMDNSLTAYSRVSGVWPKEAYLKICPYVGEGYNP